MDGVVVWMTGRLHTGKTTLARRLRQRLSTEPIVLDEEELHDIFGEALPFEPGDGDAFYGTTARLAAVLARQGFVVLVAAASSQERHRRYAREVAPRFVEVFLPTPAESGPGRQSHGLYFSSEARREGSYEPPFAAEVIARGGEDDSALARIVAAIGQEHDLVSGGC